MKLKKEDLAVGITTKTHPMGHDGGYATRAKRASDSRTPGTPRFLNIK